MSDNFRHIPLVIPSEIVAIQRLIELSGKWVLAYWIRRIPMEGEAYYEPEAVQGHSCINYDWNKVCFGRRSSLEELINTNPISIELIIDPKEINKILMIKELQK